MYRGRYHCKWLSLVMADNHVRHKESIFMWGVTVIFNKQEDLYLQLQGYQLPAFSAKHFQTFPKQKILFSYSRLLEVFVTKYVKQDANALHKSFPSIVTCIYLLNWYGFYHLLCHKGMFCYTKLYFIYYTCKINYRQDHMR